MSSNYLGEHLIEKHDETVEDAVVERTLRLDCGQIGKDGHCRGDHKLGLHFTRAADNKQLVEEKRAGCRVACYLRLQEYAE